MSMSQRHLPPTTAGSRVDLGSTWLDADADSARQWRVSWDPNTGDLTTAPVDDAADVRLLGRLASRADVDNALAGWAHACVQGEDTSWVANRISFWFAGASPTPVLEHASSAPAGAPEPQQADRLPAAPVVGVLAGYRADVGESDMGMLARGLGLDEHLVEDLMEGRVTMLNIEQIATVCEGLMASPYDLWHPDEARTILHAYGPERWPRTILPLDDLETRGVRPADSFVARRLDQQAGEIIDAAICGSARPSSGRHLHVVADDQPKVQVTAYSITGLLAVDKDGRISEPSMANVTDPGIEYHFQFTAREHAPAVLHHTIPDVSPNDVAAGPPPGQSVHPRLGEVAEALRIGGHHRADMVRFTAPDGQEAWVGWDPDTQTWDAWDDPRDHFPGPGEMLIEARSAPLDERLARMDTRLRP